MSDTPQHIIIKTGTDPRNRPEFNAIREEINKINHPARPEVNWGLIESLALTLFRTHGVDLQTAVYYTLARTQKWPGRFHRGLRVAGRYGSRPVGSPVAGTAAGTQ